MHEDEYASDSPKESNTTQPSNKDVELGDLGRQGTAKVSFESIPQAQQVMITIEGVSTYVPPLFGKPGVLQQAKNVFKRAGGDKSAGKKMNQILYDVSGSVSPGEVLALMGPSGSGKTTLLSILGGRAQKSMKVKGKVLFNGEPLGKDVKRKLGYVMQDDLLYESLTVYETLYYAAMLRLPKTMSQEEKIKRINEVITALGLDKCRDTIIGGFFRRGISGGERKRASVGHELLINPTVMFLDEPTSGLDSTTAMQLLETLRGLAQGGRAVVTTIHQPSSRLYQQLDKLLLLSGGHVLYYGNAEHAVDFFEYFGYMLPPRVNAADFILDLASGQVSSSTLNGKESTDYLIKCSELFLEENVVDGFDLDRDAASMKSLVKDIKTGLKSEKSQIMPSKIFEQKRSMNFRRYDSLVGEKDNDRWGASYGAQIRYLFQRSLQTRRFESLSTQDLFQFGTIAVLAGLFWLQSGKDETLVAARDVVGVLFFMLMFLSFRTMFTSLFTFPNEQRHMLKERASGMYRLSAFYIARSLSDFPADMTIPSGFIIIVYFMAGLRYNAAAFFGVYGTLLLSMFVAQSYGLLLGSYFMNPKTAQAVAAVMMLAFILTGGFFVVNIPGWISWLKYLSFVYYALGVLLYVQFDGGNVDIYACYDSSGTNQCAPVSVSNPQTSSECSLVSNLQDSLGLVQNVNSQGEAVRNGMILLAFLIVLRVAVYYVLRSKTAGL